MFTTNTGEDFRGNFNNLRKQFQAIIGGENGVEKVSTIIGNEKLNHRLNRKKAAADISKAFTPGNEKSRKHSKRNRSI